MVSSLMNEILTKSETKLHRVVLSHGNRVIKRKSTWDQPVMARLAVIALSIITLGLLTAEPIFAADVAQQTTGTQSQVFAQNAAGGPLLLPSYWYLIMAALSMLVPAGFVLVAVSGLEAEQAWDAAIGGLAAIGLTAFAYWAIGFGLHFGGIGLVHTLPELQALVWEWSPVTSEWGTGWGMAGLTGWFLAGTELSPLAYMLFLAHLPWAMTAAALPVVALRGRAPAAATLLIALLIGGIIYPLAGNWVQGGGWLSALGRNVALGHGFVDFAGAGTVHLLAGIFALAALIVWVPRRPRQAPAAVQLPPVQLPLMATVGGMLLLAGALGWYWSNPLQVVTLSEFGLMRGSVNLILCAGGAALAPILYSWFVAGRTDPMMGARGLAAGVVASLALAPFIAPGFAFFCGLVVGCTVPLVMFLADQTFRLDDATGVLHTNVMPAIFGLLMLGIFADGTSGAGWQMTDADSYLGVTNQGVSGLFVAEGFVADFPSQLQAQVMGILALSLWGFLLGIAICAPLGLFFYGIARAANSRLLTPRSTPPAAYPPNYLPGTEQSIQYGAPPHPSALQPDLRTNEPPPTANPQGPPAPTNRPRRALFTPGKGGSDRS